MKKNLLLCVLLFVKITFALAQGIAINETDSLPHESAILDISSENKGILIPRIELTAFNDTITIESPAKGLLVFNINDTNIPEGFYYWDGSIWKQLSVSSTSWNLIGNESINPANDFLGTKDNNALIIKTNDTSRVFVSPTGNIGIGTNNPTQQLQITNSLSIPKTSSSSVGVVYKEDVVFIHNYKHPNADTHENTFVGMNSGNFSMTSNANSNIALGTNTLLALTSGKENTAIGAYALRENTSGIRNTSVGFYSSYSNTTANYQTAFGHMALRFNTSGSYNSAFGMQSLYNNTTGQWNSATGTQALYGNTTASYNTAIGCRAFLNNSNNYYNSTAIGYETIITASNQVRVGNSSVSSIGGYASWSNLSDGRFKNNVTEDIKGLEFILLLRPISYNMKMNDLASFLGEDMVPDSNGVLVHVQPSIEIINARNQKSNIKYTGFIAQEVKAVADSIGFDFSGVIPPQNPTDFYKISYSEFVVPLVKAVQEQQQMISEIRNDIIQLQNQNQIFINILNNSND